MCRFQWWMLLEMGLEGPESSFGDLTVLASRLVAVTWLSQTASRKWANLLVHKDGASLVQRLRICLPVQRTCVPSLVGELRPRLLPWEQLTCCNWNCAAKKTQSSPKQINKCILIEEGEWVWLWWFTRVSQVSFCFVFCLINLFCT